MRWFICCGSRSVGWRQGALGSQITTTLFIYWELSESLSRRLFLQPWILLWLTHFHFFVLWRAITLIVRADWKSLAPTDSRRRHSGWQTHSRSQNRNSPRQFYTIDLWRNEISHIIVDRVYSHFCVCNKLLIWFYLYRLFLIEILFYWCLKLFL